MNFNHKFYVIILVFLTVFSCSNDDDGTANNETDINLVTGLNARSSSFDAYRLGNPNIRMPIDFSSVSIIAYPNPVIDFLTIEISQTSEVITDVWLVSANANKIFQDTNFDDIYTENTYTVNEISQASIESYSNFSSNNINLNLEGFETGYYRVFIKTDASMYWDNIYVDNDGADITEFFDSWE